MDKPTEAQTKEFWELCGQKDVIFVDGNCMHDDSNGHRTWLKFDLNNLFQYAVPKLTKRHKYPVIMALLYAVGENKDPALALFWATYPVLKEANR